jgi:gamma-glutamyltranspeptidase
VSQPTATTSFTGAIASPHSAATEAGLQALRAGGTAIDAAIAAAAVLTVVYPHNVALGGDLVALVRTPDATVTCINASGWSGRAADVDAMRTKHGRWLPARGADAVTVPGGVRGWEALRRLGSRLPWADTLHPAQDIASAGTALAPSLADHIAHPDNADLVGTEDFDRVFRPAGRFLAVGDNFSQPALAATYQALRDAGPDGFYTGDIGERLVGFLRRRGSALTVEDFAEFTVESVDPIATQFRGLTVMTSPPNTHGFILLRALRAIEHLGVADPLGRGLGELMRIFRQANAIRSRTLADPRHAEVDVDALIAGDLDDLSARDADTRQPAMVPHGDTVGIAAADSDGYAVSLIQSVYHAFGSGLIDPDTGVLFHNRGTSFSLDPASPNVLAPRKRPVHTLMPAMTTHDGDVRHVLSTMGGQGQPQIIAALLLRAMDGASAEAAVAAPRAIAGRQADGSTPDTVTVEADLHPEALNSVLRAGFPVVKLPSHSEDLGQANLISIGADGAMTAASDPRSDGAAVVANYPRLRRR